MSTNDHSSKRMFVQKGEKPLPLDVQRRQNVPSFQIWAAVGYNWRSPIVFFPLHDGPSTKGKKKAWRLNSRRYIDKCLSNPEVLRKLREPSTVFQQDGVRPHTANIVKNFLREQGTTLILGFPAPSPDCNIIEAVWAILDRGISEPMPRTQAELKKATIRAWEEIRVHNQQTRPWVTKVLGKYRERRTRVIRCVHTSFSPLFREIMVTTPRFRVFCTRPHPIFAK